MVVERQRDLGAVRQVRGDVVGRERDFAVLHVLRVNEQDVLEESQLLQQGGADETVEVAAGDQAPCARGSHCQVVGHDFRIGRSCTRLEQKFGDGRSRARNGDLLGAICVRLDADGGNRLQFSTKCCGRHLPPLHLSAVRCSLLLTLLRCAKTAGPGARAGPRPIKRPARAAQSVSGRYAYERARGARTCHRSQGHQADGGAGADAAALQSKPGSVAMSPAAPRGDTSPVGTPVPLDASPWSAYARVRCDSQARCDAATRGTARPEPRRQPGSSVRRPPGR